MKRTILVVAVILFAGLSAATTDYDGPKDQPHIMGASDHGATADQSGGSSDDSQWSADVSTLNATCMSGNQSEGVQGVSFGGDDSANGTSQVTWNGYVQTSNPCHTVSLSDVEQDGNTYTLNITTESQEGVCVDCVGIVTYSAEFSADEPFKLEILHDGEQVDAVTHPSYSDGNGSDSGEESGPVQSFIKWLGNLF